MERDFKGFWGYRIKPKCKPKSKTMKPKSQTYWGLVNGLSLYIVFLPLLIPKALYSLSLIHPRASTHLNPYGSSALLPYLTRQPLTTRNNMGLSVCAGKAGTEPATNHCVTATHKNRTHRTRRFDSSQERGSALSGLNSSAPAFMFFQLRQLFNRLCNEPNSSQF